MSRSRKKTPIVGMTVAPSDKPFKKAEHSRERAQVRVALRHDAEPPSPRAFGSSWHSLKDGKQWAPELPNARRK